MPSFIRAIALNALLASALVSHAIAEQPNGPSRNGVVMHPRPTGDASDVSHQEDTRKNNPDIPGFEGPVVETREEQNLDEDNEEQGNEPQTLERRKGKPAKKTYACPKTNRYDANTFSAKQVTKAYQTGIKYAKDNKQIGENKYPHKFGNREGLKFDCGKNLEEFPILTSGQAYTDSSDIRTIPDRVVFERKGKTAKLCGVIRHGNGQNFENCPAK